MNLFGLEEFVARRRTAQTEFEEALADPIEEALVTGDFDALLDAVAVLWAQTYLAESGEDAPPMPSGFRDELFEALQHTDTDDIKPTTASFIAAWLATATLSHATAEAAAADEDDLFLEWVDMDDEAVRPTHRDAAGQQRPIGEPFDVAGVPMPYPGWPGAPIDLWANCRCTLRPVLAADALAASAFKDYTAEQRRRMAKDGRAMKDGSFPIADCADLSNAIQAVGRAKDQSKAKAHIRKRKRALGCPDVDLPDTWALEFADYETEKPTHAGLAVQAADTGRVLMIQRALDQDDAPEVRGTWEFPGGTIEADETPEAAARREFAEEVGCPVPAGEITNGWRSDDGVYQGFVLTVPVEKKAFEVLNPEQPDIPNPDDPQRRNPDISAWFTIEQVMNLGPALRPECREMDWSVFQQEESEMPDDEIEQIEQTDNPNEPPPFEDIAVAWHGVLAPEGIQSGDRRSFTPGSLRTRPLPLPLTWQKTSASGHDGNVVVAKIEKIARVGNEMRASGSFLLSDEANEVVGLIAEFGRFGVSVDADETTFEIGDDDSMDFTDARIASACIVPIPAFAEAWVGLGPAPEGWLDEGEPVGEDGPPSEALPEEDDALVAADVAPGRTEDGPGWLTHPVDTDRLRDYWVRGPGAAKIGWGAPGDFNRCRVNLAKYVKPQHLSGYCANRHYDALGIWPGQHSSAVETLGLEATDPAEALSLIAAGGIKAPAEWFADPKLEGPTPLTITEEGRVFGHLAQWDTCHSSWADQCVVAPRSQTQYAHFLLGEVLTTEGPVACGSLTIGGGHAPGRLRARPAAEHYDSTSTAFADVTVGEDEFGIWFAGWVRPGVPDEMIVAARASKLSGDWRKVGNNLELVAALAVNVPGFAVPRVAAAVSGGEQVSLVAAGVLTEAPTSAETVDVEALAVAVANEIEARAARKAKMAELAARFTPKIVPLDSEAAGE